MTQATGLPISGTDGSVAGITDRQTSSGTEVSQEQMVQQVEAAVCTVFPDACVFSPGDGEVHVMYEDDVKVVVSTQHCAVRRLGVYRGALEILRSHLLERSHGYFTKAQEAAVQRDKGRQPEGRDLLSVLLGAHKVCRKNERI